MIDENMDESYVLPNVYNIDESGNTESIGVEEKFEYKVLKKGTWYLFLFIGSYHQLSKKYLQAYIEECCFKYNNRLDKNVFGLVIANSVR
jgi:hypothetical protein